jgi:signal transduction histidine kinase
VLIAGFTGWAAMLLLCAVHVRVRRRLVLVARASHELRGPLCAARLGLDTLAGEPARVAAIDLELRRAARALDDLAAARSGTRVPAHRELVDLRALIAAHAPAWQALARAHTAELRLEGVTEAPPGTLLHLPGPGAGLPRQVIPAVTTAPVRRLRAQPPAATPATAVYADPVRIAQACANLVANAAEHGGGVVRVRVCAAGDAVRLEVADAGPGLPAPVSVLVASARHRRARRGHGLAIAAAVAADHGGRLTAAPASAGARLVLELPAAAPAVLSRRRAVAPPEIVA